MSTQPVTLNTLIAFLQQAWSNYYAGVNANAIAVYKSAVATAQATSGQAPAPPELYVVNNALIAQLEADAVGSTTPAQWAQTVTTVPYPPIPVTPPAAYTLGDSIVPGLFKLIASGAWPADGQQFAIGGTQYIAHWAGPFGPVYAQQV